MGLLSANKTETNTMVLEIKVEPDVFEKAVQNVFRKQAKSISVPGFRKGKAPRHIVERMYGEGVFYEDAMNDLLPDAYQAAVDEAGIEPVDQPQVEVTEVSKENGFTFKATVTVMPEVEVKDYKGLTAERRLYKVTDEEVEGELGRMADKASRMVSVEDRAALQGDQAIIDFEGFMDGTAFEGGKGDHFPLTLGSGQFIPGFEDQVVGHKPGESFDVTVTFPEDYQATELAGKEAVFKVTLHELKVKELPEMDDEFAKDVSEFDTLDELRADVRKKLEENKKKMSDEDVENQLIDKVVEHLEGEIPEVMYKNRADEMMQEFDYRLQSQGFSLQSYLQYGGLDPESFRQSFMPQAERQVKVRLALEKIAELEKLEPTEEEIEAEIQKMAEMYKLEADKIREIVKVEDIKKDLSSNKAIDLVRENAVITEVDGDAKPEETEKPTKKTTAKKAVKKDAADTDAADEEKPKKKPAAKKAAKKAVEEDAAE